MNIQMSIAQAKAKLDELAQTRALNEQTIKDLLAVIDTLRPFAEENTGLGHNASTAACAALSVIVRLQIPQIEAANQQVIAVMKQLEDQLRLAESGLILPGKPGGVA